MQAHTIGRAARKAGVNIETVRFYERRGLIEQPQKGDGYRIYSPDQVARICFIKEAQQFGFSLNEIHELLALRADPSAACADVRQQDIAKLEEVQRKIEQLHQIGAALETLIAACPGQGALQACSIMDALTLRSTKPATQGKRPQRHSRQHSAKEHQMKTALFKIDGMRCNGCATPSNPSSSGNRACRRPRSHVTRAKQGILYDPETIAEERLVATVQKLGPSKTSKPIQEGVLKVLRVPSPSISEKFSAGGSRVSGIHGQPEPDDVEIEERKAMAAASVPELYLDSVNPRAWQ